MPYRHRFKYDLDILGDNQTITVTQSVLRGDMEFSLVINDATQVTLAIDLCGNRDSYLFCAAQYECGWRF